MPDDLNLDKYDTKFGKPVMSHCSVTQKVKKREMCLLPLEFFFFNSNLLIELHNHSQLVFLFLENGKEDLCIKWRVE